MSDAVDLLVVLFNIICGDKRMVVGCILFLSSTKAL